ncbi:MAG: hypothetical protein WBC06_03010 [Chitinophagaceae bacterium]
MYYRCILIFACLIFVNACIDKRKNDSDTQLYTFLKDIPLDRQGRQIRAYEFKNMVAEKLSLELLENGFDSQQIRIWFSPVFIDSIKLVSIINTHGKWIGYISNYKIHCNMNRESIDSISGIKSQRDPKSGWQRFFIDLISLDFMTLPDVDRINQQTFAFDVGGVAVEISTKSMYRFYHYLTPSIYPESLIQAKKMERILKLVEHEFDFKWQINSGEDNSEKNIITTQLKHTVF